jgi:ectoine hydroxylase-related dioxygenase (phytanoyl-CoA dioxygenase family)
MPTEIARRTIYRLRDLLFEDGKPGTRCLLEIPAVRDAAIDLRSVISPFLGESGSMVAVQAIAFDKTARANWKVTWHQDLMFPFARRPRTSGYDLGCVKDGIDFARPPLAVLEQMIAVRLHLDDCGEENGPLRVSPGTHLRGFIKGSEIATQVEMHGERACVANVGDALLMKPLVLHASSPAMAPQHRRVLHVVYYCGADIAEPWHAAV